MNRIITSLIAGVIGIVLLLAGLGWDAWLHGQDETLAAREGIFTLTNPGHALLAAGIALACGGIFSALHAAWGLAGAPGLLGRRVVRHGALGVAAWASIGAVAFALSVSSAGHAHGDVEGVAEHTHEASVADTTTRDIHVHDDGTVQPRESVAADEMVAANASSMPVETGDAHTHDDEGTAPVTGAGAASNTGDEAHAHADQGAIALADAGAPPATGDDTHMHVEDGGTIPMTDHHIRPNPTAEELACLAGLTAEAKPATARFADFDIAQAEGYRIPGLNPQGEPGTHYPNRAYMLDGTSLELANPETLIYVTRDDGTRRLVGAMYRAANGSGPQPCGNATWWHTHNACIDAATGAKTQEAPDGSCAAGLTVREGQIEMMHLWFVARGERRS